MDIIIEGINVSKQLREIKEYIANKSYEDALADKNGFFHNISYEDDDLFDFGYENIDGTIHNDNGVCRLNEHFSLYRFYDNSLFLHFDIEE